MNNPLSHVSHTYTKYVSRSSNVGIFFGIIMQQRPFSIFCSHGWGLLYTPDMGMA